MPFNRLLLNTVTSLKPSPPLKGKLKNKNEKTRIGKVHGFSSLFHFTFKILTRIMMKSLGEEEKPKEEEKEKKTNNFQIRIDQKKKRKTDYW